MFIGVKERDTLVICQKKKKEKKSESGTNPAPEHEEGKLTKVKRPR